MKQLKKDYYALPDAAERSARPIDDFLWLAEHRHIILSVEAHHWPLHWGDERVFPGATSIENDNQPAVEIENPGKPPFDSIHSGYLNIFWYDIRHLREDMKLSLTEVYAEHNGRKFIGHIQKRSDELRGRQHECDLELNNVLISHEDLQRVENHEVGDWDTKVGLQTTNPAVGLRAVRKFQTQCRHESFQGLYNQTKKEHPGKNDTWISLQISKILAAEGIPPTTRGYDPDTIRKNMKTRK